MNQVTALHFHHTSSEHARNMIPDGMLGGNAAATGVQDQKISHHNDKC